LDINKSLTFAFNDEKWLAKLGTGALVSMLPFLNFAWNGYTLEIMRRVVAGHANPLPDWDDLGGKWIDGLTIAIAGFIYSLPGVLFLGFPIAIMAIPALLQDSDAQAILALAAIPTGLLLFTGAIIYFLLLSLIFPAVQLSYSQTKSLKSCFEIGKIFKWIRADVGGYLIAWLSTLAGGLAISIPIGILGILIGWIPCLGQIMLWVIETIAVVYIAAFSAHLFGQFGARVIPQTLPTITVPEIN
jgi:hypothetical protein